MFTQNSECPWNVPVPVISGDFSSLFREHDDLNVRVDPTGVGAFGCAPTPRPEEDLLLADLQTNFGGHIAGRLGSGRAGFMDKWYLKGVGRTPLAANWNRFDHLHNTGHLAASSAIREYVVTAYLKAHGCANTVVGCEGLLFSELDPHLADFRHVLYRDTPPERIPAVDGHFQAISIKSGNFARLSNFLWLLHHLTPARLNRGQTSLATLTELLAAALTPPEEPAKNSSEIDPRTLADMLARAVERGCERFRCWFSKGVWWGSFLNNFTADGRFLDLETPAIIGGPFFGVLSDEAAEVLPPGYQGSAVVGVELFAYLLSMRAFCTELVRVLLNLPQWFHPVEVSFAAELASEVTRKVLHRESLLRCRARAIDEVLSIIEGSFGPVTGRARNQLIRLLELEYDDNFGPATPLREPLSRIETTNARFVRVAGLPFMVTEPSLRWTGFAFSTDSSELGPSAGQRTTCRMVNEIIHELDQCTSLTRLMDRLLKVPELMREAVAQ